LRIVEHLFNTKQYLHIIAAINAALIEGQSQPWMYEILAIAMKIEDYPKKEIERVLLSQIDYTAKDINTMLFSAAFLKRLESNQQALNLYRQASSLDPQKHEPYIRSLKIARKLNDSKSVQWATVGILENAWRIKDFQKHEKQAMIYALEEIKNLKKQNKLKEAYQFEQSIKAARVRDLDIELIWSGEGELDFFIEEPSGTICSHSNSITNSGGVYVHDGFGPKQANCYEKYINRIAPSGVYKIRIHHVDTNGNIVGNRATLNIIQNRNSVKEKKITQSVLIARTDSFVKFSFHSGRQKNNK
jgi:hypothetical protein